MAKYSIIEKIRVPLTKFLGVVFIVLVILSRSAWEESVPIVTSILFFTSIILVAIASLGRLWCSLYIAGYKTKVLITKGPYTISRNPLYFFSLLGAIGVGFGTETFIFPVIILIVYSIYYPFVIKSEEVKLHAIYGKEFEMYMDTTLGFFPKISKLVEPDKYIVNPVIFRKHIFSALWFVWIIAIFELIEELHELGWLTSIFKVY